MGKNLFKDNDPFSNFYLVFSFGILGLTALIFQVVFARSLVLLFGLTAPAVATILAVFFFGLALGSLLFGKISDTLSDKKIYHFYIWIFVLIGLYGFLFPLIFKLLKFLILSVNNIYPLNFAGFNVVAFFFSFIFLAPLAILFGGGFPIISKIFIRQDELLGKKISLLYFINTFGGVVGTALAGFWLIPSFGSNATIFLTAILNIIVAGLLFQFFQSQKLDQQKKEVQPSPNKDESLEGARSPNIRHPVFLYTLFITGFLALALEVLYTKTMILFIGSSTYAFSLILIIFLLGIAKGSWIASFFIDRLTRGYAYFGIFLGLIGFWLFLTIKFFEQLPFWYLKIFKYFDSFEFSAIVSAQSALIALVILPATFLMGIIFPLGIKLANPHFQKLGEAMGKLYFANAFGGVLGGLAAGFLLIPLLGYQKTFLVILSSYLLLAVVFVMKNQESNFLIKGFFVFFFILWMVFGFLSSSWQKEYLSLGVFPYIQTYLSFDKKNLVDALKSDEILFYKEGQSNVAVIKRGGDLLLRINGQNDALNTRSDIEAQILIGALPMLFHSDPKEVLVIGLGSGIALGTITQFDKAENIAIVEIDPSVIKAANYFKEYNNDALNDPRVKTILADGRNYLLLTDKKYDIISSESSNLWVSGAAHLFTKEFYELAKTRLKENGLMVQRLHTVYSLDLDSVKSVLKTFSSIFPQTYLFQTMGGRDLLIVGSMKQEPVFNFSLLEKKFSDLKIKQELERIYIFNPYDLVPYLVADESGIREFTKEAKINSDQKPFLEFSSAKAIYQDTSLRVVKTIANIYQKENHLALMVGGEEGKLKQYFSFSQKLFPFKVANVEGDLFGAIDSYIEAKKEGLFQYLIETYILQRCNFIARATKQTQGDDAANQIWEKCSTVFNEIAIE